MRVRSRAGDSWLSPGEEYPVLSIDLAPGRAADFRVVTNEPMTPILVEASKLEITVSTVPSGWVVVELPSGGLFIGYPQFADMHFWERYFNQDDHARQIYESVLRGLEG